MKYAQIVITLLISGCSITNMIDPYGEEVKIVCETVANEGTITLTLNEETKLVGVHKTDDPAQIYDWCNSKVDSKVVGCASNGNIYIPSGPTCYTVAAHELGHVFGVPGMDRPTIGIY
ncbi:MAG: hypothetical protein IMF06_06380 [Proteobacteria bacterium]|nr:hypothetical protein [Pseudomonadota bacterium]